MATSTLQLALQLGQTSLASSNSVFLGNSSRGVTTSAITNVNGRSRSSVVCTASSASSEQKCEAKNVVSRRDVAMLGLVASIGAMSGGVALADADEDYKRETLDVIEQVRTTLALEKTDPAKVPAVAKLRQAGNEWVAKYRKSKKVAGKPSFSNMYSVVNAISGHYVSFGATYPIPAKRKDRILDEVKDAEKALNRGR